MLSVGQVEARVFTVVRSLRGVACVLAVALGGQVAHGAGALAYRLQGQPAPDFALRSWQGPNLRLSEYRGEVVALTFFGSRCGQCAAQLASLSRLLDTYRSAGLVALAVNVDDDQQAAQTFIAAHRTSVPMLLDPDKEVAKAYRVDFLPLLLIIDRAGRIRHVHRDFRAGQDAQYLDQIKVLLDE
ncbi:MAG: TlpA family protein disulfide reductase [Nevskiaceae bacterium]|jgi:peroxiredoxin|nr:TlpA family protein disulfide reductase [Nevskiaceae bacterium]